MALNPASYARAVGIQSEINKVTITRVAGSEVQFRRTIDTYQRDLRYHVNQIKREQKQLKRSMRKYSKKLRDSRREQKERKAKVREDSQRLRQHAQSFQQAEQALRRASWTVPATEGDVVQQAEEDGADTDPVSTQSSTQPENVATTVPTTSDSGVGGHLDEKSTASSVNTGNRQSHTGEGEQQASRPVFLTRNKLPYLSPQRGHKVAGEDQCHKTEQISLQDGTNDGAQTSDVDHLLPIIDEEVENGDDQSQDHSTRSQSLQLPSTDQPARSLGKGFMHKPLTSGHADTVTPSSLDTRTVSKAPTLHISLPDVSGDHGNHGSLPSVTEVEDGRGRTGGRKTKVSYGDLVKFQHTHTSNTKRLFQLVDRLASKHGIVDPPHPLPFPSMSSLDPRSNDKIKMRGQGPDSQSLGGMVRQAAVLYSIKYGYDHVTDDVTITDTLPPILLSQDAVDDLSNSGDFSGLSDVIQKDSAEARSDVTSEPLSLLSIRRRSMEITSPVYTTSDVRSPVLDDESMGESMDRHTDRQTDGQTDRRTDRHTSPSGRTPHGQQRSMWHLSQQASQVRERSILATDPKPPHPHPHPNPHPNPPLRMERPHNTSEADRMDRQNRTVGRLSPLPHQARSIHGGESVSSQLEKRLKEPSERGKMAWHSAFGRLKVLHTLQDLSQHFHRNKLYLTKTPDTNT